MTQDQENVTSMFETTIAFLDKNNSVWSGTAAFASAVTDAKNGVTAIRKSATSSLPELIRNTRSLFRNRLDKMMTPFRKPNPIFYSGYFAARVIVDRAATHAAPKKPAPPTPTPP